MVSLKHLLILQQVSQLLHWQSLLTTTLLLKLILWLILSMRLELQ